MKRKYLVKSPSAQCMFIVLAFAPFVTPVEAQTPPVDYSSLRVGDGTGSTTADGTFAAEGQYSTSMMLPAEYQTTGSRMLWYPRKSAFRAGYGDSTTWDEATMGAYSVAMGHYSLADGNGSTAIGSNFNIAFGEGATAIGDGNTADGWGATALGIQNYASGEGSLAMGRMNQSWSEYGSIAMGNYNYAYGNAATAMGEANSASSYAQTVIGSYGGSITGNPWEWSPNDPVFQIGNGHQEVYETSVQVDLNGDGQVDQTYQDYLPFTNSNALTVYKNGDMELQRNLILGGTITSSGSPVLDVCIRTLHSHQRRFS